MSSVSANYHVFLDEQFPLNKHSNGKWLHLIIDSLQTQIYLVQHGFPVQVLISNTDINSSNHIIKLVDCKSLHPTCSRLKHMNRS